jgi:kynurenine formamidase
MERIDLSQSIESGMPVYPGSDPVSISQDNTIPSGGSRVSSLDVETHVGTHVDAPSHMLPEGRTITDFDLSAFVFDVLVVDLRGLAPRTAIGVDAMPDPEEHDVADADLLVCRTGWETHWGTERYRDHPYLSAEAAAWCADHGFSVGLDTFSPDPTPSADPEREGADEPSDQPAHDELLGAGCRIVENLRGLGEVPRTFELVAYPLRLAGSDGSPVRAVAHVAE